MLLKMNCFDHGFLLLLLRRFYFAFFFLNQSNVSNEKTSTLTCNTFSFLFSLTITEVEEEEEEENFFYILLNQLPHFKKQKKNNNNMTS